MSTLRLGVNIDHVATLRQARYLGSQDSEPNILIAANEAQKGGADSITAHLREDRRHIQDEDIKVLREGIQTCLNLELANSPEIVELVVKLAPAYACLVPEKRDEITTEGGLNVGEQKQSLRSTVKRLQAVGIQVSLFIDPVIDHVKNSADCGADIVELHTGSYANAKGSEKINYEVDRLIKAATVGREKGLQINAGHGITTKNLPGLFRVPYLSELNVGHHLVSRSIEVGLCEAVSQFRSIMDQYPSQK